MMPERGKGDGVAIAFLGFSLGGARWGKVHYWFKGDVQTKRVCTAMIFQYLTTTYEML